MSALSQEFILSAWVGNSKFLSFCQHQFSFFTVEIEPVVVSIDIYSLIHKDWYLLSHVDIYLIMLPFFGWQINFFFVIHIKLLPMWILTDTFRNRSCHLLLFWHICRHPYRQHHFLTLAFNNLTQIYGRWISFGDSLCSICSVILKNIWNLIKHENPFKMCGGEMKFFSIF